MTFQWSTSNVKAVYFYHDGQNWQNHGVPGVGQSIEYPPNTMNYYLRVVNPDNSVTVKTRTITVNQPVGAPVINQFSVDPPAITVGQCVNILWQVSGQVSKVTLVINTTGVWPNAPVSGSYQDCPATPGQSIYQLTAQGPGGSTQQQVTVNVKRRAAAAAHGHAGTAGTRAGDQRLHDLAGYRLTGRLHVVLAGRRAVVRHASSCCATMRRSGIMRR